MHQRHLRLPVRGPRSTVALLGVVAVFLTGCSSAGAGSDSAATGAAGTETSAEAAPVKGGNLIVQISQDPGSLDYLANGNVSTGTISHYIFEKLFALDAKNHAQPMLVDSYTLSDDKLTYTFTLRDGVVFSDGSPLTSKDAVATLRYWMRYSGSGQRVKKRLDTLKIRNTHTFVLSLTEPWPVPVEIAASDGSNVLKASVAKGLDAQGFDNNHVIGTGPYKLKSWSHGQKLVLERNEKYSSRSEEPSGYAGAKHAYFDTITFKVVSDQDAIANGLKTGLWDVATTPSPDQYAMLKNSPNVEVSAVATAKNNILFLNHHKASIMSKPKARKALNLVIDKDALTAVTGIEDLTVNTGAYAAEDNANLHSTVGKETYNAYNPQKAKRLFAAAGYDDGEKIRFLTTGEFPQFKQWAVLIQDQLRKIGVESTIGVYDFGTMIAKAKHPSKWDVMPLTDSASMVTPVHSLVVLGLLNFLDVDGGYHSDTMDRLVTAYMGATSDAKRQRLGKKIQAQVWKDKPAIVLSQTRTYVAYTNKLRGYNHYGLNFYNAWMAR